MDTESPLDDLDENQIRILRKKLLVYATRIKNKYANTYYLDAEDLVHEALHKVINGDRKIDTDKYQNLFIPLAGCIRSIAFNEVNRKENKIKGDLIDFDHEDKLNFTPEEISSIVSELKTFLDFVEKKKYDLLPMAKAILIEGIDKPKDLACHLSQDVKKINTDKKRLKRIYLLKNGK